MVTDTQELIENFMALPEAEKEAVRRVLRSSAAIPLAKVFGLSPADMKMFLQQSRSPQRGLAARQP